MSKLPPEKRNRLALLALGTTVALSLYWALAIRIQREWLIENRALVDQSRQKLAINQRNTGMLSQFRKHLESRRSKLDEVESSMAAGDVYRWLVDTFAPMQKTNGVSNLDVGAPTIGDSIVLPRIPYQEATFTLSGKAYFHDLGRFLADLENDFPHMSIRKLDIEPARVGRTMSGEGETLSFRAEISTLVKPGPPDPGPPPLKPKS